MDYGKLAYMKVQDLSRRVSSVVSKSKKYLFIRRERVSVSNEMPLYISFFSAQAQTANISIDLFIQGGSGEMLSCVYINGLLSGMVSQRVNSYSSTAASYAASFDAVKGVNVVAMEFNNNTTMTMDLSICVEGTGLSLYGSTALLNYHQDIAEYTVISGGAIHFYKNNLSLPHRTEALPNANTSKVLLIYKSGTKMISNANGSLKLARYGDYKYSEEITLAENVSDFSWNGEVFFMVEERKLYEFSVDFAAGAIVSKTPLCDVSENSKVFATKNYYLICGNNSCMLVKKGEEKKGLFKLINPQDIKQASGKIKILQLDRGVAKEIIFDETDLETPESVKSIAACDAVCYCGSGIAVLFGDKLSII